MYIQLQDGGFSLNSPQNLNPCYETKEIFGLFGREDPMYEPRYKTDFFILGTVWREKAMSCREINIVLE